MNRYLKLISALVVLTVAFSNVSHAGLTNCQKLYQQYLKAPGHKAYATTLGNDPGYHPSSCYYVSSFTFKKKAEQKAVEKCNQVRRKMDGGKCKVISSK